MIITSETSIKDLIKPPPPAQTVTGAFWVLLILVLHFLNNTCRLLLKWWFQCGTIFRKVYFIVFLCEGSEYFFCGCWKSGPVSFIKAFPLNQTCSSASLCWNKPLCLSSPPVLCSSSSGTPINKRPVLGYKNLNLFKLYRLVHKLGGFEKVSAALTTITPADVWFWFYLCCFWCWLTLQLFCVHFLSRSKVVQFGSKSIRIWGSLCLTLPLATMSNVLTASKYRSCSFCFCHFSFYVHLFTLILANSLRVNGSLQYFSFLLWRCWNI